MVVIQLVVDLGMGLCPGYSHYRAEEKLKVCKGIMGKEVLCREANPRNRNNALKNKNAPHQMLTLHHYHMPLLNFCRREFCFFNNCR